MSDDIDERYRRAAARDPGRPGEETRTNILAHARNLAASRSAAPPDLRAQPAANRNLRRGVAGTVVAATLAGLLLTPHWRATVTPPPSSKSMDATAKLAAPAVNGTAADTQAGLRAPAAGAPAAPPAVAPQAAAPPAAQPIAPRYRELQAQSAERRRDSPAAADAGAGPALRQAAGDGDLLRLRSLLESTAVDDRDARGRTALMAAAVKGQSAAVEMLLARGADPNAVDAGGSTALQLARDAGREAVAGILQRAGAH